MNKNSARIMVNGEMTSDINVMDRGFQYGDGLFETMRVVNHRIPLWQQHWQRLTRGCKVLSINVPDKAVIEQAISQLSSDVTNGVIKLVITRGIGGRGYAIPEQPDPGVVLLQSDYPQYPDNNWQEGINVRICDTRLARQPRLAGIKHLNRLEQVLARNEWMDENITEGIMIDDLDNVIEGTMTNLFIVSKGKVYTSTIEFCGVAGVMRETVLTILDEEKIPYEITSISREMLGNADEAFMTNSVIGLWPVKKIDDTVYSIGSISKTVQKSIDNIINA